MYSKILTNAKSSDCKQRLICKTERGKVTYAIPVLYNESRVPIAFDPWGGEWIKESFDDSYTAALIELQECQKKFDKEKDGLDELIGTDWLFKSFEEKRSLHSDQRYCTALESLTRYGERGDTALIELPNIRVVAILDKEKYGGWSEDQIELYYKRNGYQGIEEWEFSGWTPIDFCPFCGARLPNRLDEKLSEILKEEYGLDSWKDYERAPREFHTDEWWRKRGL